MNNFNQVCPTGNHMTEGNPAEEYADRKGEEENTIGEEIADEFYSLSPKYRTKKRLQELINLRLRM